MNPVKWVVQKIIKLLIHFFLLVFCMSIMWIYRNSVVLSIQYYVQNPYAIGLFIFEIFAIFFVIILVYALIDLRED